MGNETAKLNPTVMSDLIEKTSFQPDEIHNFYREFEKGCSPGRLAMSRDEFKSLYTKCFPSGDPGSFAEHVFNRFELDDQDRVRFCDVLAMLTISLKGSIEQRLEWTFNLYDIHRTGFIEREELMAIIKSIHKIGGNALPANHAATPAQLCDYIFQRAEADKHGRITPQNFVRAASESKTIQNLMAGTLVASSSPFLTRKNTKSPQRSRSGSPRDHMQDQELLIKQ